MKYYVYTLTDPRNDEVFYVGKGTGKRIDAHESEARHGVGSPKCERIREIKSEGFAIIKTKVEFFADEKKAYARESALIQHYGSQLTNGVGGDRCHGAKLNLLVAILRIKFKGAVYDPARPFTSACIKAAERRADSLIAVFAPLFSFRELANALMRKRIMLTHEEYEAIPTAD